MTDPVSFTCIDCGSCVYDFIIDGIPDPPLCGMCAYLRAIPNAREREALRKAMQLLTERGGEG
jgi:hypothetical protein